MARAAACIVLLLGLAPLHLAAAEDLLLLSPADPSGAAGAAFLADLAASLNASDASALREGAEAEVPVALATLRPILAALPKNLAGRFEAPAVRYALHRYFVRQYGWHLTGLDPAGAAWNSSSPAQAAALLRLPDAGRAAVEMRLLGGMQAEEVAVLAVTLELLVHSEATIRLVDAYAALGLPLNQPLPEATVTQAVELYMASFLLGKELREMSQAERESQFTGMEEIYPSWPRLQTYLRAALAAQRRGQLRSAPVSFQAAAGAVEEVGHGFGRWQGAECASLKASLMELEDRGTGRVRLSDFYKAGLNGKWQFQESEEYLRKLGTLDETSPGNPRVIIPNWVGSPSNCIGTSESHEVCCISECEQLLSGVELALAAPAAGPDEVAAVVAGLASSTVPANRDLGPLLRQRLQVIAREHDGLVPIYGRLFAQWMHHAYPRECPYPHLAGTTQPMNIFDWEEDTAKPPVATETEMQAHAARRQRREAPVQAAPWVNQEELFARPNLAPTHPVAWLAVHFVVAVAALTTAFLGLLRTARHMSRTAAARPAGGKRGLAPAPMLI